EDVVDFYQLRTRVSDELLDGDSNAAVADYRAVGRCYGDGDTTIHEQGVAIPFGIFGIFLAFTVSLDLPCSSAVFLQELSDRVGAAERERVVETIRASLIRVADYVDFVVRMRFEQIGQAQKAGEAIDDDCLVGFEIDFLPVVWLGARVGDLLR